MAKVSRELSQRMLVKRAQGISNTAALGLVTAAQGEEFCP